MATNCVTDTPKWVCDSLWKVSGYREGISPQFTASTIHSSPCASVQCVLSSTTGTYIVKNIALYIKIS